MTSDGGYEAVRNPQDDLLLSDYVDAQRHVQLLSSVVVLLVVLLVVETVAWALVTT